MQTRKKYIGLFFVLIFSFLGTSVGYAHPADIDNTEQQSTYSATAPTPLFHSFIKSSSVQFVYSELPTSFSSYSQSDDGINTFSTNKLNGYQKQYCVIQQYSYFGITIYDLIYPYHYFW